MKKRSLCLLLSVFTLTCVTAVQAAADQEWIRDILERKDRYWNMEVTVAGEPGLDKTRKISPAGTVFKFRRE